MKCQQCEKPATFHITDLSGDELLALHLCPECAKHYLHEDAPETPDASAPPSSITGIIQQQLTLEQTAEDLKELDTKECPICGVTFYEFRQSGRLGCPHDYDVFGSELEQLLINVHGAGQHVGKQPKRNPSATEVQTQVIRLRRDLQEAIEREDYENASEIRDQIRDIEGDRS